MDGPGRRAPLPGQVAAEAVQFLSAPTKKAAEPADDDEKPSDKPAVGAYRRKAG